MIKTPKLSLQRKKKKCLRFAHVITETFLVCSELGMSSLTRRNHLAIGTGLNTRYVLLINLVGSLDALMEGGKVRVSQAEGRALHVRGHIRGRSERQKHTN